MADHKASVGFAYSLQVAFDGGAPMETKTTTLRKVLPGPVTILSGRSGPDWFILRHVGSFVPFLNESHATRSFDCGTERHVGA
jgi:hypothetical protein